MPYIILFKDSPLESDLKHVFTPIADLSQRGEGLNNETSSFVILDGNWQFFDDAGFRSPPSARLENSSCFRPQHIYECGRAEVQHNITSLRPVQLVDGVWEPLPVPVNPDPIG
jgi:hypothetical protein